ncbi:hypothetical protein HY522_04525 [bacterium]|nr:hypothetical protein [bacterium]
MVRPHAAFSDLAANPRSWELFAVAFLALFLELMLIRWVPSIVRIAAYFSNIMLISAFLGLGLGCLASHLRLNVFRWFPVCLTILILYVCYCSSISFGTPSGELRYLWGESTLSKTLILSILFAINTVVFVPLGERLGDCFFVLPRLIAYAIDLAGSFTGCAIFGVFSYLNFSPSVGVAIPAAVYVSLLKNASDRWGAAVLMIFSTIIMGYSPGSDGMWSPYYHIHVIPYQTAEGEHALYNPPMHTVRVNHDFYFMAGTLNPDSYTPGSADVELGRQYFLPYQIGNRPGSVLVLGSGGGMDVEAALLSKSDKVDAVEIDPRIIQIGKEYNYGRPYQDPRVSIYNTDARAFLRQTTNTYDRIIFGFLDSQSLFTSMTNIRLDGFVYTQDSFQNAYARLNRSGIMSVSFATGGRMWLFNRLIKMAHRTAGEDKVVVYLNQAYGVVILLFKDDPHPEPQETFGTFRKIPWPSEETGKIEISTDDWPFLYLSKRFIPYDYLVVITVLILISVIFMALIRILSVRPPSQSWSGDGNYFSMAHFFLLGFGFMMLETASITKFSLIFGTTWLVSLWAILGVLLMIFGANLFIHCKPHHVNLKFTYIAMYIVLAVNYFFPSQRLLSLDPISRWIVSSALFLSPLFFAGLIFSKTFLRENSPVDALGSNLIGATMGGFAEYSSMAMGLRFLVIVIFGAYLLSHIALAYSDWPRRSIGGNFSGGR